MLEFLVFIMATVGATFIITFSYIFKPIREWIKKRNNFIGKLIECPQCSGFWMSFIIQFIILIHSRGQFVFYYLDFYYITYGFIGSLFSYIIYLLIKPLMDKYD